MKNILPFFIFLFSFALHGQHLESLIPGDCIAVAEINSQKIFSQIAQDQLEKMLGMNYETGEPNSLSDFGFDFNESTYVYYTSKDSIGYINILVPVDDAEKVATTLKSNLGPEVKTVNGHNFITASTMAAGWNNDYALMINAMVPRMDYSMDDLIREHEEDMEADPEDGERRGDEEGQENPYPTEDDLALKKMFAPFIYTKEQITGFISDHFTEMVKVKKKNSLAHSSKFQNRKVDNSSIYYMVNKPKTKSFSIEDMSMSGLSSLANINFLLNGVSSISGNVIFTKDEAKVTMDAFIEDDLKEAFSKIYNTKSHPIFNQLINDKNNLGYMVMSYDFEEYLNAMPEILGKTYGNLFNYEDEISAAMDLISIALDEEALGELHTGETLIALHDLEEKQVTYTDYEYDDEYNRKEVEKTKTEHIPLFSMLVGSENRKFIDKLFKIGKKRNWIDGKAGHYSISNENLPFDIYFLHKDGMFMVTNSKDKVSMLNNLNLSKSKQLSTSSLGNFVAYLNMSKGADMLSTLAPPGMIDEKNPLENFKSISVRSKFSDEYIQETEFVLKTDGSKENAMNMILTMLNNL